MRKILVKLFLKLKLPKRENGFTLIEALIAITVLTIGVIGPMAAATRGITEGIFSGNRLTASALAQEAMELTSAVVENNLWSIQNGYLSESDWLADFSECDGIKACNVSFPEGSSNEISVDNCGGDSANCQLVWDESSFRYVVDSSVPAGSPGVYTRRVNVQPIDYDTDGTTDAAKVTVIVGWYNRATADEQSIQIIRYLYRRA